MDCGASLSSGLNLNADLDAVEVPFDIFQLAEALDFDPWQAISKRILLAAVKPGDVKKVTKTWENAGITNYELGRFKEPLEDIQIKRNNRIESLPEPKKEPFWELFFAGLK